MRVLAIALVLATCALAHADAESDADAAFRAASQRATTDAAGALADFEALGARRPITRWTDNAWAEAARLAERAGDYARARRDLEQVIATGTDDALVRRATLTLERLAVNTGGGAWDVVAKRHEALVSQIYGGDDPQAELAELAALVRANPTYPRVTAARVAIARGWEMEGEAEVALGWMREAVVHAGDTEPGQRTRIELARMAIRVGELDATRAELAALARIGTTDRAAMREVARDLDAAVRSAWIRRGVWGLLALLAVIAVLVLRRDVGGWRGLRRLARPPIEVVFLLPLSALVVAIAATGNPLVARAIVAIAIAGIGVAWLSGALVDAARPLRARRLAIHVALVLVAVGAIAYLAVEGKVIRLLLETWRGGHAH